MNSQTEIGWKPELAMLASGSRGLGIELGVEVGGGDRAALRDGATDLERMARLVTSNERLFRELRRVRFRLDEALAYWKEPGANRGLARARLARLRAQHAAILTELRVNRREALVLLARHGEPLGI
jgi:hypothetical protein